MKHTKELQERYPQLATIREWINIHHESVQIDGWLSFNELRILANVVEQINKDFTQWYEKVRQCGKSPEKPYNISWKDFIEGHTPEEAYNSLVRNKLCDK